MALKYLGRAFGREGGLFITDSLDATWMRRIVLLCILVEARKVDGHRDRHAGLIRETVSHISRAKDQHHLLKEGHARIVLPSECWSLKFPDLANFFRHMCYENCRSPLHWDVCRLVKGSGNGDLCETANPMIDLVDAFVSTLDLPHTSTCPEERAWGISRDVTIDL